MDNIQEAILEQLKEINQQLAELANRAKPNPNWVDACPRCDCNPEEVRHGPK